MRQWVLVLLAIGLVLGYEDHLYKMIYPYLNLATIAGCGGLLFLMQRSRIVVHASFPLWVMGGAALYSLMSLALRLSLGVANSYPELAKNILMFFTVALMVTVLSRRDSRYLLRCIFYAAVGMAVAGLVIITFGEFFLWDKIHSRLASIWFDPNYYGVLAGFMVVYALFLYEGTRLRRLCCTALGLVVLFFSFSKGAMIALVITLLVEVWRTRPLLAVISIIFLPFFAIPLADWVIDQLSAVPLLRVKSGMNLRDVYWSFALDAIKERPFIGYGLDNIQRSIEQMGYDNTSFHNAYIEQAYSNGVPFLLMTLVLMGHSALALWRHAPSLLPLLVYLSIGANNFSYSIGGVGLLSVLLTLIVCYPYQREPTEKEL